MAPVTELRKHFIGRGEVKGFEFEQLSATDNAYLYEVTFNGEKHYEFFKRKVNTQYNQVSYPTSKAFGVWAWTTSNKDLAIEKFNEL